MEDLRIYKKAELLYKTIHASLLNFPKRERYGLTKEIEQSLLNVLKYIQLANKVKSKRKTYIEETDGNLHICKALMKLSLDFGYISQNYYIVLERSFIELSKMISSWMKSTSTNKKIIFMDIII